MTDTPVESGNALEAFEKYLSTLPPELRKRIQGQNTKAVMDYIAQSGDASMEQFLPRLDMIASEMILRKSFPPIRWVVEEYLPPGMTFISGKPKVGKSWLSLQLALAVASGGTCFGKRVEQGSVLYLALEDNERRLQDRMRKQGWLETHHIDFMLYDHFRDQIGALNAGGGKRLLAYIEAQQYKLVIVDTFSRAIQGDQLDKEMMDSSMSPLQAYAMRTDVAMVMIDHMPKSAGQNGDADPIAHLYGSVAKSGVGDTFWALYKEQGRAGAKLAMVGRDVMDVTLKLSFNQKEFYWHCEGDAHAIDMTTRRKEILEALEDLGECKLSEIVESVGQSKSHTLERLNDLVNAGLVERVNRRGEVMFSLAKKKGEGA